MKKGIVIFVLSLSLLVGGNAFDKHCVPCHTKMNISLQKSFMQALLVYGGRENMQAGLAYYFKNPRADISVMGEEFIRKYGIKQPLDINQSELDEALDIYWKTYTVMGKLY